MRVVAKQPQRFKQMTNTFPQKGKYLHILFRDCKTEKKNERIGTLHFAAVSKSSGWPTSVTQVHFVCLAPLAQVLTQLGLCVPHIFPFTLIMVLNITTTFICVKLSLHWQYVILLTLSNSYISTLLMPCFRFVIMTFWRR